MAYSAITNAEIDPESPATTALMTKYRDNNLAVYQDIRAFVAKANDEDLINDNTLGVANDSELLFAVGANEIWFYTIIGGFTTTVNADFKFSLVTPGGTGLLQYMFMSSTTALLRLDTVAVNTPTSIIVAGAAGDEAFRIDGYAATAGAGGNVQFQWCQNTSHGDTTTIHQHTHIVAQRYDDL